ncbi:hypothetical protein CAN33_0028210 [Aspergillus niger]|uniref:Micro-fibrillar-associated protein 1 C-terminal domain-containing protein n=1 Tax=Aspergillus niger TaxID=5061 RepID=A0A505IHA5_ASPNG|nr:hypothetical protein CAN33_0028210 [Aspergillus niger]
MPPPLPSHHRGMTANPVRPSRYRPGKAIAEEPSSLEQQRRQAPKASSFPAGAAKIARGVKDVKIEEEEADEDEEGFVTEEEEEEEEEAKPAKAAAPVAGDRVAAPARTATKDKRNNAPGQTQNGQAASGTVVDTSAETEARRIQRQEKADALIREQLEKDAIARSEANRAWDDDELEVGEEGAIDDTDGKDPEAEYAAWKLRELKRIKREREAIEAAEKEREEVERRRNLTAEERDREDREYLAKQEEEKEANRGQAGYMQRYFHKGAFFSEDMQREGLAQRNIMGAKFADDVSRETLPQYMQIRDMTKLGKKGRTRYRDLKSEDTGRFGEGFQNRSRHRDGGAPIGITDERFMPDRDRDERPKGPTGANASAVRERRRSRSRSYSPRRERRDRSADRYRPDTSSRRKRSPSPYEDREKRRRVSVSPER